jgi:hypothetical protein
MDKKEFLELDFKAMPRIPIKAIWIGGLMIGLRVLWAIIPSQTLIWLLLPCIALLAWAASFGWRFALKEFRAWLDRILGEEW